MNAWGDVGTANRQPSALKLIGIPSRAGANFEDMTRRDRLEQARHRPGEDTVAGGLPGVVGRDLSYDSTVRAFAGRSLKRA
jgi:hypothetical protein